MIKDPWRLRRVFWSFLVKSLMQSISGPSRSRLEGTALISAHAPHFAPHPTPYFTPPSPAQMIELSGRRFMERFPTRKSVTLDHYCQLEAFVPCSIAECRRHRRQKLTALSTRMVNASAMNNSSSNMQETHIGNGACDAMLCETVF